MRKVLATELIGVDYLNEIFMRRAIELAQKGVGYVNPNPMVGAVIVKNGKIIGEGYHEEFGKSHAEINALRSLKESPEGASVYVTLEPCSHYGKTPPCVEALISAGISKVIIGMKDPNPLVSGRGIQKLIDSDIEVEVGVLEKEIKTMNEVFIKYITEKTPFVVMKTAMTLDGKIATSTGDSKWISNEKSRKYVHEIRHMAAGIMVGINTVLKDDPSLTARLEGKSSKNPLRIIVDSKGRIPMEAKVLSGESVSNTLIAVTEKADKSKLRILSKIGVGIVVTPSKNGRVDMPFLLRYLHSIGIDSILLEGGGSLNYSLLEEGLVDKVISFISPKIVGGSSALSPVGGVGLSSINDAFKLQDLKVFTIDEDVVIEGYLKGV